jgi:ribosomal protein S1
MKKKLVLVDTFVTYKMSYVIECDEIDHALDEVTMIDSGDSADAFPEFSQKCLGETIFDHREITKKEFDKMLKENEKNEEGSWWMGESLIRKIDYER